MNQKPVRVFQKSDFHGRQIVRILVRDGVYDGYPTLDVGFILDNGMAFSLSPIPHQAVYEFEAKPGFREWTCEKILNKPIRSLYYSVDAEGDAIFESAFIELMDGTCVSHLACTPPGLSPDVYVRERKDFESANERICDYFDEPPVAWYDHRDG